VLAAGSIGSWLWELHGHTARASSERSQQTCTVLRSYKVIEAGTEAARAGTAVGGVRRIAGRSRVVTLGREVVSVEMGVWVQVLVLHGRRGLGRC